MLTSSRVQGDFILVPNTKWQSSLEMMRIIGMFNYFDFEFFDNYFCVKIGERKIRFHKNEPFKSVVGRLNDVILETIGVTGFYLKLKNNTKDDDMVVYSSSGKKIARILDNRPCEVRSILSKVAEVKEILIEIVKKFPQLEITLTTAGIYIPNIIEIHYEDIQPTLLFTIELKINGTKLM